MPSRASAYIYHVYISYNTNLNGSLNVPGVFLVSQEHTTGFQIGYNFGHKTSDTSQLKYGNEVENIQSITVKNE